MALLALLISLLINGINGSTISQAVFHVDRTGIDGTISALNGFVWMQLDFADVNWTALPEDCAVGGLKWHVHTEWTWGDSSPDTADRMLDDCAYEYTGNHYDPWFACGSASGAADCESNGGCIPPSSIYDEGDYYCTPADYDLVAYACEVGDWSGKYGTLDAVTFMNGTNETEGNYIEQTFGSYWETDRVILSPDNNVPALYSVVLHCNSGERAFCAPILRANAAESSIDLTDDQIIETDFYDAGNGFENMTVKWTSNGMTVNIPETAADQCDEWEIAIYNSYNYGKGSKINCDTSRFGGIYDPTHTCIYDSGSPYCTNGTRCVGTSNTSADYSCSADDDWFGCAVGDMSARIGIIQYDWNVNESFNEITISDPKSPPLFILADRAIVFECIDNTSDIINICAGTEQTNGTVVTLEPVITDPPTAETESPTDYPTDDPTTEPTMEPTFNPTEDPTKSPTGPDAANAIQFVINIVFVIFVMVVCL